jgi:hypothetical protein
MLAGSKVKQDNDPNCMSYMEVGQCVHEIFLEVREKSEISLNSNSSAVHVFLNSCFL